MRQVVIGSGPRVICKRCVVADTPWLRLKGLLGTRGLEPGEGLLIEPAAAIHTCFMRFAIDTVFLDRDLTVLRTVEGLRPWRAIANRGAHLVLELAEGECRRHAVRTGDRFRIN